MSPPELLSYINARHPGARCGKFKDRSVHMIWSDSVVYRQINIVFNLKELLSSSERSRTVQATGITTFTRQTKLGSHPNGDAGELLKTIDLVLDWLFEEEKSV